MGYSVYPPAASGITASDLITVPNWEQIAFSNTPNTATITFSSIPTTYKKLRIVAKGIYNSLNGDYDVYMRFNGDSGNNYGYLERYQNNASTTTYPLFVSNYDGNTNAITLKYGTASNAYSGNRGSQWDIEIENFDTTIKKINGNINLLNSSAQGWNIEQNGTWRSASATTITSITLTNAGNNFATSSGGNGIYLFGAK